MTRASIRSIAASDPDLLEEALAFAGPSEALFAAAPSRDQVWGGRAYAASDLTGTGFAGTAVLGRGIPTAVSYAENTYSVYLISEHGALGGIAVMMAYMALLAVVGVWIFRVHATVQETTAGLAVLAMTGRKPLFERLRYRVPMPRLVEENDHHATFRLVPRHVQTVCHKLIKPPSLAQRQIIGQVGVEFFAVEMDGRRRFFVHHSSVHHIGGGGGGCACLPCSVSQRQTHKQRLTLANVHVD